MDTQKQQIVDSVKQANNILVTVSNNPSVDQLAACIGLTLALNKMKKHATAVFSGAVPPIIDFLEPEKTLEKTTDSLRDFIIAIDKAKADKLRYKVEENFVKIFITPYRTSISQKDLEFSEGDFNVDVVLALGVHKQTDLDQAITAHGRIMHDATVISINNQPNIELGSINLLDPKASSLSEITVGLLDLLDKTMVDSQIATALLTGIVAETDRFRNAKTTPVTMSVSAELLTAGANQQLVASKLDAPAQRPIVQMGTSTTAPQAPVANKPDDGTLEINHDEAVSIPRIDGVSESPKPSQIHIDEHGQFQSLDDNKSAGDKPPLPQAQSMGPMSGSLPPLGGQPGSSSPLNPFASPSGPQASPQQIEPSVVSPAVIQPDPNAVRQNQQEEPVLPPKSEFPPTIHTEGPHLMMQPPTFGSQLNAGISPQDDDDEGPSGAAMSLPQIENQMPLLQREPLQSESTSLPPLPPLDGTPAPSLPPLPQAQSMGPMSGSLPPLGGQPGSSSPLNPFASPSGQYGAAGGLGLPPLPSPQSSQGQADAGSQSPVNPSLPPLPPLDGTPAPSLPPLPQAQSMGPMPSVGLPPPPAPKVEPSPATPVPGGGQTESPLLVEESLTSLERDVKSPHIEYIESPAPNLWSPPPPPPVPASLSAIPPPSTEPVTSEATSYTTQDQKADVESARGTIEAAFDGPDDPAGNKPLEPVVALNAQPLGSPLHEEDSPDAPPPGFSSDPNDGSMPLPPSVPPPLIPPTPS